MDGATSNSSSDFVRKLYKMLEDPSYKNIVRWSDTGDSFVVLENEKFTKNILPKHFKHSNFASFVRQLNKYDFHKVKSTEQDNGQNPYGAGAWEFRHPDFQANGKHNLDNIRRKAPAPRKPQTVELENGYPAQQIDLVNTQLVATQHQLQHLQERYNDLAQGHVVLLQQVVQLQKFVKNHDGVMHKLMNFLQGVDQQRRTTRMPGMINNGSNGLGISDLVGPSDDRPASPLQQASALLGQFSAETLINKDLMSQITLDLAHRDYTTPPEDQPNSSGLGHGSGGNSGHMDYASLDLDNMVYPIGQTTGIDPINSEHFHNIPYSLPQNPIMADNEMLVVQKPDLDRKKNGTDAGWGPQKPRILLVEDDKICARIGCKFLQSFECGVETASDGLEAVNKINSAPNAFDLILMDIIMPHLDGVSATVCIREFNPTIPIIAMTSNIRSDDIEMYFRYGMNDVLPKPFTKEGMLRALEKSLARFKKSYVPPQGNMQSMNGSMNLNMAHMSANQSMKDDQSPGRSPSTSWQSPNNMSGGSPSTISTGGYSHNMSGGYTMTTPTHTQPQVSGSYQTPSMSAARTAPRRISDIIPDGGDDRPDKRQRMFPPPQGTF